MIAPPYAKACAFFKSSGVEAGNRFRSAGCSTSVQAESIIASCVRTEYACELRGANVRRIAISATAVRFFIRRSLYGYFQDADGVHNWGGHLLYYSGSWTSHVHAGNPSRLPRSH